MKEIPLTQNLVAIVDDEDFEVLSKYKWYANSIGPMGHVYAITSISGIKIRMHRFLMAEYETDEVDHRDGNGLNNQKSNLRVATHSQNMQNSRKRENTSSKFRGVYFDSNRKKWAAQIKKDHTMYFLGRFNSEIAAAQAYDEKALELYGEDAAINFQLGAR